MTTTIDFAGIDRRLLDAERKVLTNWEKRILGAYKGPWTNWRYEGRPRDAERNVSLQGWQSVIETTEASAVRLRVFNRARDYRTGTKAYVAYVARTRGATPEYLKLSADVEARLVPPMVADLRDAIVANLNAATKSQRRRATGGGATVSAAGLVR